MASKLVTMKVNKKILQNDMMETHNKVITSKDVHNLVTSLTSVTSLKSFGKEL